ncbi:hypothetical protein [Flavobacterium luteolum]|uniref:hypothetical protein n=1 Tax=Flavobacterium luteolum TaxID=3003259 RepID=UPI00248DA4E1|nr:hypothetical protein [Flavobacterium luteolum]
MAKFSITKELKTIGEINTIAEKILKKIPEDLLFTKSKEELCAFILNEFDFPGKPLKKSDITKIEKGCTSILLLMGVDDDFEKKLLFGKEENYDSQIDRFLYYFLNFIELPGIIKGQLEAKVKFDLDSINDYINEYEKIEFIQKGETPRNHNQRTQNDFYKRCLEERVKIESHLEFGLKSRALSKSRRDNLLGMSQMMFEDYEDRPYKLPLPKSNEYFDFDKIDKVGHRLGEIPIRIGRGLKELYINDKKEFYKELEKEISDEKVLKAIINGIEYLPFIPEQRKRTFLELVDLYDSKKWYGFYSLALTQIEGLFTEMCRMCDPSFNSPYAALPDKVNVVRSYHPYSESSFDYFQYYLPNLRNRFLHYGLDSTEEIEILCKELLWDLTETVSIYVELNIEALWMLRLIRRRNEIDFLSVSGLCYYFDLIGSLRQKKQIIYFESEIKELNERFLPDLIFNVVSNLEERINSLIELIYETIKVQSNLKGFKIDLNTISFQEIADNEEKIKIGAKDIFKWQFESEVLELLHILKFLQSYKQILDLEFIAIEAKMQIDNIDKEYSAILKKIKLINLKVNLN